ncbi:MAG: response regulator [Caulobacterales bacterium]|uniref:response regulator n=1 Tax=Glycocaulis sp. TaxID=1969725 RepID=UPI003FA0B70F
MQFDDLATSTPVQRTVSARWQDRPILIVDPSNFLRRLVADVLRHAGADRVSTFGDIEAGLNAATGFARPIIIADWSEKGSPGPALTRALRRKNLPVRRAPIIALGSTGQLREVERARDAGVNGFVLRPVSPAMLFSRLDETVRRPRAYVETDSFAGPDRRIRPNQDGRIAWKRGPDVEAGLATPLEAALAQADAMAAAMMRQGDMIAARVGRSLRQYLETVKDIGPRETEIITLHRSALRRLQEFEGAPPAHRNELVNGLEKITARRLAA